MPEPGRSKISYLLERLSQGVAAHDRENPGHHTWGIGMAHFDIERLGLEEGEEILPGIVLQADGGVTGAFRVLCDGNHDGELEEAEEEVVDAVAEEARELEIARPGGGGSSQPEPIRPPF
ncbi:MAG TPA: hypothetical protein VME01_08660 [Solirubrobacteraceae bacterium]|nr:hypothetical protein [Solirubrobacteraceae bacterium]